MMLGGFITYLHTTVVSLTAESNTRMKAIKNEELYLCSSGIYGRKEQDVWNI
jgi:hypothetical protein